MTLEEARVIWLLKVGASETPSLNFIVESGDKLLDTAYDLLHNTHNLEFNPHDRTVKIKCKL